MRMSLIVAPPCGTDSSQAPVQRSLILTPNKYRMLILTFCNFLNVVGDDDDGAVVNFFDVGSALAMSMHILGKSDQNIVVIVSNERQTTGNIATCQRTAHGAGLSRGGNPYNSIHAKNMELD